jgi:mono/diheme cytochrome c family protein
MIYKKIMLSFLLLVAATTYGQAQTKHRAASSRFAMAMANGKKLYTQNCLTCHQADGSGVATMNPPLIKTTYVLGDKATLTKIVLNGFNEDVQINGQTYSNTMTPHDSMKDQEIADVLTYVRNSFGNKASSISAALVKNVRAANKK